MLPFKRMLPPAFLLAAGVLAAAGCDQPVRMVKVEGVVKLEDKPLPVGTVTFYPVGKTGVSSIAAAVENGKYQIPAIPADHYLVAFTERDSFPKGEVSSGPPPTPDPAAVAKVVVVPGKYRKPTLPVDLLEDSPNLNFDLKSN